MSIRMIAVLGGVALCAAMGVGVFLHFQQPINSDEEPKKDTRITQRNGKIVAFKSADDAESYGIASEPAKLTHWQPRLAVDGRVVPNPSATLEVCVPFAGAVQAEAATPMFRLGAPVRAQQMLANFEVRFTSLEKLDLRSKSLEAEERYKSSEKMLKLREERQRRLETVTSGAVSRADFENASYQLIEAQTQKDIALSQWQLWKQALDSIGQKSITVAIRAPMAGEIAEIGAQPGAQVEAGRLLVKIVDFRRVLIRLDFPPDAGPAPPQAEIETPAAPLEAGKRWQATLRGAAASVEPGLQKTGYLYEIMPNAQAPSPNWRPGLFVKSSVPDPARASRPVVAIPASALLVHQGRSLVYIERLDANQKPRGRYERCEVQVLARDGDVIYLSSGLRGDELVVSRHPQVILSEEFRSDVDDDG